MADELISRQAVMEVVYENQGDDLYLPDMVAMRRGLMQLPAVDAVPVVRCKNCKHRGKLYRNHLCDHPKAILSRVTDTDFCSYGEWREENV